MLLLIRTSIVKDIKGNCRHKNNFTYLDFRADGLFIKFMFIFNSICQHLPAPLLIRLSNRSKRTANSQKKKLYWRNKKNNTWNHRQRTYKHETVTEFWIWQCCIWWFVWLIFCRFLQLLKLQFVQSCSWNCCKHLKIHIEIPTLLKCLQN